MLSTNMIQGFKKYFKNQDLSDRRIKIVEIEEKIPFCGQKRKISDVIPATTTLKKSKLSLAESKEDCDKLSNSESVECFAENETSFDQTSFKKSVEGTSHVENSQKLSDSAVSNNDCSLKLSPQVTEEFCTISGDDHSHSLKLSPQVTEEFCTMSGDDHTHCMVELNEDIVYSEFPVHSIVLCVNSEYFQKMLVDCNMKESKLNTISIKVPRTKGKYLEMLIQAFYNEDILKNLQLSDLLQLLEMANRFSCTSFVKQTLKSLNSKEISSIDECDSILVHLSNIYKANSAEKIFNDLKNCCTKFLSEYFYPLELKREESDIFTSLSYPTMHSLLSSKHLVTLVENHLFIFIYKWLLSNKLYQTSSVIESLLTEINTQSLTPNFLHDEISICDKILNIWEGYPNWFSDALKYHLLSPSSRCLRSIKNIPLNNKPIATKSKQKMFVQCNFHFVNGEFINTSQDNHIVWAGCIFTPKLEVKKESPLDFIQMKMLSKKIFSPVNTNQSFYKQLDVCYAFVPGNTTFDMELTERKKFRQRYLRRAEVIFKNKMYCNLHNVAIMGEKFSSTIATHGLNLVIFFKAPYTSNFCQYDWSNIKPSRKLIKFK